MDDYVKESIEVSDDLNFGEAYDKEWALKDEGRREGKIDEKLEIAKSMLNDGVNIESIYKYTGLTEEEINKLKEE